MGEKRNPYIPTRPDEYYGHLALNELKDLLTWAYGICLCIYGCISRWWFQSFFIFTPTLWKSSNLTNVFQMD